MCKSTLRGYPPMGRKALAAILLPLPFAALPIAVVAVGALFGPSESGDLVIQEDTPAIHSDAVLSEAPAYSAPLASVSEPVQFDPCADYDLRSES
jgi:hypothetical protein